MPFLSVPFLTDDALFNQGCLFLVPFLTDDALFDALFDVTKPGAALLKVPFSTDDDLLPKPATLAQGTRSHRDAFFGALFCPFLPSGRYPANSARVVPCPGGPSGRCSLLWRLLYASRAADGDVYFNQASGGLTLSSS